MRTFVVMAAVAVAACGEPQRQLESGTMGSNGQVGDVVLRNVVVEAPPGHAWEPGDEARVRLTVLTGADQPDALVEVRTGAATRVELRADRDCDGVAEPVDRVEVPTEGTADEPVSAYELRIVDFTREVLAGTTVPLTFVFEDAGETTVDAMVEATGDGDEFPQPACAGPSTSTPGTSTPGTSTPGTSVPSTPTSAGTPPSRPEVTLSGTVQVGVESGCLVLATDRGQYVLLGADPQVVRAGAEVVVEGVPQPDQATTCQQGTPFTVRDARPAPADR
ncbi:copper chaperone PCu(A)C [Saccharothrix isguenensis]